MSAQHSDLRAAEDELQHLRTRLAAVAQWIHNPAYDRDARTALAQAAGLPGPTKEGRPPCPADTSPGGTGAPHTPAPATYAEPAAPTSALAAAGTATAGSSAH
ncbi:hypothetical protein [Streptomyces nigrescens]|uniref:hypothetical protein n=1 Tax=Streptomyces nigrescens TaxID=1920 RepID=UPI0036FF96D9